jgi:prolyl-tRNA synthetase
MRGREFLMKDLYSYCRTEEEHTKLYEGVIEAYHRVFARVGIGEDTFLTFASGGAFTQFSHEFQTITEAGEDMVYLDREKKMAINEEVFTDEVIAQLGMKRESLEKVKTSEAGNIFSFGGKKCEDLGLFFTDEDGSRKPVILGSYGIGITRLMGIVAEKYADEKGLVWPEEIAPFHAHILSLDGGSDESVRRSARTLYDEFQSLGINVLWDDRDLRAGEKFAESDFLGIPYRVVVSTRSIEAGGFELKKRTEAKGMVLSREELITQLQSFFSR